MDELSSKCNFKFINWYSIIPIKLCNRSFHSLCFIYSCWHFDLFGCNCCVRASNFNVMVRWCKTYRVTSRHINNSQCQHRESDIESINKDMCDFSLYLPAVRNCEQQSNSFQIHLFYFISFYWQHTVCVAITSSNFL